MNHIIFIFIKKPSSKIEDLYEGEEEGEAKNENANNETDEFMDDENSYYSESVPSESEQPSLVVSIGELQKRLEKSTSNEEQSQHEKSIDDIDSEEELRNALKQVYN